MNCITQEQRRRILDIYLYHGKVIDTEKMNIDKLTRTSNVRLNGVYTYFDSKTGEVISAEEYKKRYYKFVLRRDIK